MYANPFIEAVLFDVDGVVVESELLHLATFNEVLSSFGIQITDAQWRHRFVGKGSDYIMKTVFTEHDITDDPAPWIDRRRKLYQRYVEVGNLHPVPGFLSFYVSIQETGLSVAFVTTAYPTNVSAALRSIGLEGKHPVIDVTSVKRLKPDPEAYLLAAQILNVLSSQCIVFEDSPAGISAAKAANMLCVALTTTNPHSDLEAADLIIDNFQNITIHTILTKLNCSLSPHS